MACPWYSLRMRCSRFSRKVAARHQVDAVAREALFLAGSLAHLGDELGQELARDLLAQAGHEHRRPTAEEGLDRRRHVGRRDDVAEALGEQPTGALGVGDRQHHVGEGGAPGQHLDQPRHRRRQRRVVAEDDQALRRGQLGVDEGRRPPGAAQLRVDAARRRTLPIGADDPDRRHG
jgi:hypothetical protein